MRVLHVISMIDPKAGGPPIALEGLATAQKNAGLDVQVLATRGADDDLSIARRLESAGVQVTTVGPTRGPLGWHRDLRSTAERCVQDADIVVIHALWEDIQHKAARAARRAGVPYIIRPCGMLDPWSLSQSRWRKRLFLALRVRSNLNHATALHFTTDRERELVEPLHLRPPAIIEPNGLDLSDYQKLPQRGTYRQTLGIGEDVPVVLFMSRLHHKKGLDVLVPAFARSKHANARLLIAGPGDDAYIRELQDMIEANNVSDRVQLVGMLHGETKLAALQDADLFALTSYQENFGNVVIEAMGCGTPVLISDQVNLCYEVAQANVGAVVPTNVNAVTAALDGWLADRQRCAEVGQHARSFTLRNFDWQEIARRWVGHYQRVLDSTSSS